MNHLLSPNVLQGVDIPRWRAVVGTVTTVLAAVLTWFVLLAPDRLADLSAASLLRIPVEGLVIVALLIALPSRAGRAATVAAGVALGLVANLKIVNFGFHQVLDRPAHLATDWPLLGSAVDYVTETSGRGVALALQVAAALAALAVPALMILCLVRVSRVVRRHRSAAVRPLAALTVAWVVCAVLGTHLVPGQPVAARTAAAAAHDQVVQVRQDLRDRRTFAEQLSPGPSARSPADALLGGLRGKDVVLAFVESYGRSAVEDPGIARDVKAVLTTGTRDLAAAGFTARSAFLTSPTVGGGSWMAHATLLSGTWVNNQARYDALLGSQHPTLVSDFNRAGWRTVAALPGTGKAWPEGSFYGYDRIYTAPTLGYNGPRFSWSPMPDQYALSVIQHRELAPPHRTPVMVEVELTSSHNPWAPLPELVDWDAVGDGSVFDPMPPTGTKPSEVIKDPQRMRTEYGHAIQYSLATLISFVATYGTDDTVLVLLGDHQPVPALTQAGASRDVPITIVARDPAVFDRISAWGWYEGLLPRPEAPLWTMDSFRDRFVSAFSASSSARTP